MEDTRRWRFLWDQVVIQDKALELPATDSKDSPRYVAYTRDSTPGLQFSALPYTAIQDIDLELVPEFKYKANVGIPVLGRKCSQFLRT